MSVTALTLPLDIPWVRLAVSPDMVDLDGCDRKFPPRWRSSVAIFGYEPAAEDQTIDGSIVSYVKVVATVTGFQLDGKEIHIPDRGRGSWRSRAVADNLAEQLGQYYPAFGAMLEVSVTPASSDVTFADYPYFSDFDPKKRELYETVTDTGEVMSRSLEDVGVRLGKTTSTSHEVYDKSGWGISGEVSASGGGYGGKVAGQYTSESGTKDVSGSQYENVRTTDSARETRETLSHTTQLSQMYHQLTSYHLGTNRAVFFLEPRPHIIDNARSFVNGPRELEGIQEFFLVVVRPDSVKDICLEAYLETAHLGRVPIVSYPTQAAYLELPKVDAPVNDDADDWYDSDDDSYTNPQTGATTYTAPLGWEIDTSNGLGWDEAKQNKTGDAHYTVDVGPTYVTLKGFATGRMVDNKTGNDVWSASIEVAINVYIRDSKAHVDGYKDALYLTGRGTCTCPDSIFFAGFNDHVTYELPDVFKGKIAGDQVPIQEANARGTAIGKAMRDSIGRASRYARGDVYLPSAQFIAESTASLIRSPGNADNQLLAEVPGVESAVVEAITSRSPGMTRGRLLLMPIDKQVRRFGLDAAAAASTRRALLGLRDRPEEDSAEPVRSLVPDLIGENVSDALGILRRAKLVVGRVAEADNEEPAGSIRAQSPEAGMDVPAGSRVDVYASTGRSVRLPDVVGLGLTDALCALRDAGLKANPEIESHAGGDGGASVVAIDPRPGSRVTPNARVTLTLSAVDN